VFISIIDIIGWIGTVSLLLAYALSTTNKIIPNSKQHHILNLIGAFLLGVQGIYEFLPNIIFIQFIWSTMAIIGLVKIYKK